MSDAALVQSSAVERWSAIALELGWIAQWIEGAIFPTEMVFFLASAEASGLDWIIESGRQDGYSTQILGEFAHCTGIAVSSIDYEEDPERGRRCRERLARYPLDLRVGNAFDLLGAMVRESRKTRIGLLIDGPKGFSALSLVAATAADPRVGLIAMHNQDPGTGYRRMLESVSNAPLFHEEALSGGGDAWRELRRREREHCIAVGTRRSLERSTLAVLPVGGREQRALGRLCSPSFKLYQPPLVRLGWRLGRYRATGRLFTLSFRLFGS